MSITDVHDWGYSVARHILDEIATHPEGLSASALGGLVADDPSGHRMGAWLRELRTRGWVRSERVSPGSLRTRWFLTDEGHQELSQARASSQ